MTKDWQKHTHYKPDACVILQMQKQQQAEEIQAPRSLPEILERKYESE
jgi:hypothetical protein